MNELTAKYRTVLLERQLGRDVLADILANCHFGCTLDPDNKVQVSEHNVGVTILHQCGIFGKGTMDDVLRALSGVSPHTEGEE